MHSQIKGKGPRLEGTRFEAMKLKWRVKMKFNVRESEEKYQALGWVSIVVRTTTGARVLVMCSR